MIRINDKKYELAEFEVKWGRFKRANKDGVKEGIAPRLLFYVGEGEEEQIVLLELTFTKDEINNMKEGVEVDLENEVTDIIYDDGAWISLAGNKCVCLATRLSEKEYSFKFETGDDFEEISIEIDEVLSSDLLYGDSQ